MYLKLFMIIYQLKFKVVISDLTPGKKTLKTKNGTK